MSVGLALLGATGSIGKSALEVVRHHRDRFRVVTLAAQGREPRALAALAREFDVRLVAVAAPEALAELAALLPPGVEAVAGAEGLLAAATHPQVERVIAAVVGAAGLPPVAAALTAGKWVALANKESLVVAGRLLSVVLGRDCCFVIVFVFV